MIDRIGKPLFMNIDKILDAAEEYMTCDDGQLGLWILDHLPAYYMDNYPQRAYEIKRTYYKKLWTIADYLQNSFDSEWNEARAIEHYHQPCQWRKEAVQKFLKHYNQENVPIHIYELGAANYWLPLGLRAEGYKFTYQAIGPDTQAIKQAKEHLKDLWCETPSNATIFVCMEVIEHCMDPMDVFHYYAKLPRDTDFIVLSTPRYMVGGGLPGVHDWRNKDQGHVKTYGAMDFFLWARNTFNMHDFGIEDKQHLILTATHKRVALMTKEVETTSGAKV
jgi:2-polyprenyl-3-methyl-5-hydroxy-6-metoxy-1,4-benzoquinol methylase